MSGVDLSAVNGAPARQIRKGAASAVSRGCARTAALCCREPARSVDGISAAGGAPLVVAERIDAMQPVALGVIQLKDIVKQRDAPSGSTSCAAMGIQHRDDHRRQSAHREGHRRRSRASTITSRRRRPRTKMALIKREQQGRPARRDDRRRHQRRPGTRPGGRWRSP